MNTNTDAMTNTELDRLISWISTPEGNLKALSVFTSLSSGLSERSRHVLESIYGGPRPTVGFLVRMLSISGPQLKRIPNCGRKSAAELLQFKDKYLSLLLQAVLEDTAVRGEVIDIQDSLGYVPFFKHTELVMAARLTERERAILDGCIPYRDGQQMRTLDELAKELGVTRERVRQLRIKIIDKLPGIFKTVKGLCPDEMLAYNPLMSPVNVEINAKDDIRHVGYSGVEYGDEYRVIIGEGVSSKRRTVEESMRLLEEFILANGRYPCWSKDDEDEYRLWHFVHNRRHAAEHGRLTKEDTASWRAFEAKYRMPNMPVYRRSKK